MALDITQYPVILDVYLKRFRAKMPMHAAVSNQYGPGFAAMKKGDVAKIQLEPKYVETDGFEFDPQTLKVETADVVVDKEKSVSVNLSAVDMSLNFDSTAEMERAFKAPSVDVLAAGVENNLNDKYKDIAHTVGTAGTLPSTHANFYEPIRELIRLGLTTDELTMFLGVDEYGKILDYLDDRNNDQIVSEAIRMRSSGTFAGVPVVENLFRKIHTAGTADANYDTNGANQGGDGNIIVDTGTGTFVVGDVITIEDVNSWNYAVKQSTAILKDHVIDTAYAGGAGTISLAENLIASSTNAFRNVDALAADGKNITLTATHKVNLIFAKRAFGSAIVPLADMEAAPLRFTRTHEGISMTMSTGYNFEKESQGTKVMVLYGAATTDRTAAIRLAA
jgi:hypothetical protein